MDQQIDSHWKLRRKLRQLGNAVNLVRVAFRAMRAEADAQKAHRELKKACRERKKAQLLAGLESVENAAQSGDGKA